MLAQVACRALRRSVQRHVRGLATASDTQSQQSAHDNRVRLVEVGPRDGLQNEKKVISLETKIELIERLARTGVTNLEAGSFVSPKWVPQVSLPREICEPKHV
jgi:hydroxymethylglutaryl-CoA lyase